MKKLSSAGILFLALSTAMQASTREYDPETGRFLQEDPIFAPGESPYVYANNNPILFVDPLGLRTELIVWQPTGYMRSSFGHLSLDINGTMYTFGPTSHFRKSTIGQVPRNVFFFQNRWRAAVGLELNITSAQEKTLEKFLQNYDLSYSFPTNTCGTPVRQGLNQIGINAGSSPLPISTGLHLIDLNVVSGFNFYPATP